MKKDFNNIFIYDKTQLDRNGNIRNNKPILVHIGDKNLCFTINNSPFDNCQIWGIASFQEIYSFLVCYSNLKHIKEFLSEIKKEFNIKKPLLVIDIDKNIYNKLSDYLKFYSVMEYQNTNTRVNMVICLIYL